MSLDMAVRVGRAIEMLRLASRYIDAHCPDRIIQYDNADCDGACVADDCLFAANDLVLVAALLDTESPVASPDDGKRASQKRR